MNKSSDHNKTSCPACSAEFEIAANRSLKIREKTCLLWFYDVMNQFENFSEVTCPQCKEKFKAPEARLFGVFKSPYVVFALCCGFAFLLAMYMYIFEIPKR